MASLRTFADITIRVRGIRAIVASGNSRRPIGWRTIGRVANDARPSAEEGRGRLLNVINKTTNRWIYYIEKDTQKTSCEFRLWHIFGKEMQSYYDLNSQTIKFLLEEKI